MASIKELDTVKTQTASLEKSAERGELRQLLPCSFIYTSKQSDFKQTKIRSTPRHRRPTIIGVWMVEH